jgi:Protein of unknown function (DUF2957)
MTWHHRLILTIPLSVVVSACGAGDDIAPAPVAAALCAETVDYGTVFTGGTGAGELIQMQIDTNAMTYRITYLASPVPTTTGTVTPTRANPPDNVVSGTLRQETLLPTERQNRCAFRLENASLDSIRPARIFLGDGVLGGTVPGAEIAFSGVAGVGVVPKTRFPYYPFIAFSQQSTDLAEIAGTYTMLGYHKLPSQNFLPVEVDATLTIHADGSLVQCDNNGIRAGKCQQPGTNLALRQDSPAFESHRFVGQTAPTQAVDGPQAQGILVVGKTRGELVPVLVRVGVADPSIHAPPGSPPKTPLADDESGIALLAPQAVIGAGSRNGQYVGVDSNFSYRAMALIGRQSTLLDPFHPSQASLASALDLDFAQPTPGVVSVKRAALGSTGLAGKMIFAGAAFGYLDNANPRDPYFAMGAFAQ